MLVCGRLVLDAIDAELEAEASVVGAVAMVFDMVGVIRREARQRYLCEYGVARFARPVNVWRGRSRILQEWVLGFVGAVCSQNSRSGASNFS